MDHYWLSAIACSVSYGPESPPGGDSTSTSARRLFQFTLLKAVMSSVKVAVTLGAKLDMLCEACCRSSPWPPDCDGL